jgi:cell division septum initiation protein DivIVA
MSNTIHGLADDVQTELAKAKQEIEELKKQLDARPLAFSSGAEVAKAETPETKSYLKFFG